jgi:hypothetical protein
MQIESVGYLIPAAPIAFSFKKRWDQTLSCDPGKKTGRKKLEHRATGSGCGLYEKHLAILAPGWQEADVRPPL